MVNGIGTGYAHSGNLANIFLLGFELKNIRIFSSNLINFLDHDPNFIVLKVWKRYIDDGSLLI